MRQNLLQSAKGITKCDKKLLRSVTGITKCDSYYKVRRNSEPVTSFRNGNTKKIAETGNHANNDADNSNSRIPRPYYLCYFNLAYEQLCINNSN